MVRVLMFLKYLQNLFNNNVFVLDIEEVPLYLNGNGSNTTYHMKLLNMIPNNQKFIEPR